MKQDAIRREQPNEIDCEAFLELHSDYVDGLLLAEQTRGFDAHAASCTSCGRYDRVVRRGLLLARNAGAIEPSADFHERLSARLREPEPRPNLLSSNVAYLIAAILLIACLAPLVRFIGQQLERDASAPVAGNGPVPSFDESWWRVTGAVPIGSAGSGPLGIISITPAGSYSPLVIQAPLIEPAPAAPRLVTYPVPFIPAR